MMGIIPVPNMGVIEWTDKMTPELYQYGSIIRLDNPDNWKDWARSVILAIQIFQGTAPNPDEFQDWRNWAERFLQVIP